MARPPLLLAAVVSAPVGGGQSGGGHLVGRAPADGLDRDVDHRLHRAGLLAAPARNAGGVLRTALRAWGERRKQAAEDDKLWALAQTDARLMADISRAMSSDAAREVRYY